MLLEGASKSLPMGLSVAAENEEEARPSITAVQLQFGQHLVATAALDVI
jgi:hypothetical protein